MLILWFVAGYALEALYLVRREPRWGWLGLCVFFSLILLVPAGLKSPNALALHIGIALGFFALLFAGLFRDAILPIVGEKLLLTFTVIFWYGFATELYRGTHAQQILALVCLVPTVMTVYAAWTRPTLGFGSKLALYTWYLLIIVFLGWLQFPFGTLSIFAGRTAGLGWLGPLDAFATGMASLYLLVNAFYLYMLIPIPGRSQSFSDRMAEWHRLTDLMTQRCSEQDGPSDIQAAVVLALIGGGLAVNYVLVLVPPSLAVSLAIIAAAVGLERLPVRHALRGAEPAAATSADDGG